MDIYLPNKMTLAKMFNYGNAIFNISGNASNHMSTFIDKNKSSDFILIIDRFWYINRAWSSKRYDQIREYAGELIKIINATGIGTCSNGIFSLAIEPIWKTLLSDGKLPIFGYGELNEYENGIDSIFRSNSTIDDILHLDMLNISDIRKSINNYGGIEYLKEQKQNLNEQILRNLAVQRFTPKRLCTLLEKCGNRTPESDRELISIMGGYSDVPTIYEYLIAMAMFHLSNQKMHIANSINMNITSDGLPLRFAGGWQADIVIDIDNRITIVEVTLMDSRAQEKGEMPSVIRHTISNIEAYSNKSVNTIFIAPTINPMIASIWKSLRSSEIKDEHGELVKKQVIIDTITNNELIHKLETL